jgi:phosphatidylserine/phosphatidylglycerophosphate/cardiolipin synthase-like enzyme
MRIRTIQIFTVAVAVSMFAVFHVPYDSDAADGRVLIHEVNPYGKDEGVSLYNYGGSSVSLSGYSIRDDDTGKEGRITIGSLTLEPNSRITFVKEKVSGNWFSERDRTYDAGSSEVTFSGSFVPADAGDDLYLYDGDRLIDAMCYGNKTASEGWIGEPVQKSSTKYFLRTGVTDTDSAVDWLATKPGLTNRQFSPSTGFSATVTPFVFPESRGEPVYRALEEAESEVLISIYQISSVNVAALLCMLEGRGVDVRMIVEGDALGYAMATELTLLKAVSDAGGEIVLINDKISGNYERFDFVHNKYAVVDGRTVIITSENWTSSNMGSGTANRGWGAVVESEGYAGYMREIFENDISGEYGDVHDLNTEYPGITAADVKYIPPAAMEHRSYAASVTPVLSPDDSYVALKYYMDNAQERIYAEQLDLGSGYMGVAPSSPVYWMAEAAAERDVDARLILDASTDDAAEHEAEVDLVNATTKVQAATINGGTGFGTNHNKGVIIDDKVWIGSVNWTSNSFLNNREAAVVVDSTDVTDYFLEYFMTDWSNNSVTEAHVIAPDRIVEGQPVVFTAAGAGSTKSFEWDVLGNDDWVPSGNDRIVRNNIPPGEYTLKVRGTDSGYYAELTYAVLADPSLNNGDGVDDGIDPAYAAVPAIIIIIAALFGIHMRTRSGR